MERAAGIEPASSAWKAEVLPLYHARMNTAFALFSNLVEREGFEPSKLSRQIYSLLPLATREPLRYKRHILALKSSSVNTINFQLTSKAYLTRGYPLLFNAAHYFKAA